MRINEIITEAPYGLWKRMGHALKAQIPFVKDSVAAARLIGQEANEIKKRWKQWYGGLSRQDANALSVDDVENFFALVGYPNAAEEVFDKMRQQEQAKRKPEPEPEQDDAEQLELELEPDPEEKLQERDKNALLPLEQRIVSNIDKIINNVLHTAHKNDPELFAKRISSEDKPSKEPKATQQPARKAAARDSSPQLGGQEKQALSQTLDNVVRDRELSRDEKRLLDQFRRYYLDQ